MSAPHLDDDTLSAHLDGEDIDPAAGAHLDRCAECRARLGALGGAAAAIGAAVPPVATAVREAAVARALAAADDTPRSRWPVLWGAAAAVLVALLGVSFATGRDGRDRDADTTTLAGGPAVVDGGDLGELDDARALADAVGPAIEPATADTAEGSGAQKYSLDSGQASTGAPAAGGSTRSATDGGDAKTSARADPYCLRTVATTYGSGLGPLVYRATVRWGGTPAIAVAYRLAEPKGALDHRVYVLATDDCRLLVAQTL